MKYILWILLALLVCGVMSWYKRPAKDLVAIKFQNDDGKWVDSGWRGTMLDAKAAHWRFKQLDPHREFQIVGSNGVVIEPNSIVHPPPR